MAGLDAFKVSVHRLAALSRAAHAEGLLNTHIFVDGSDKRLALAEQRAADAPNPFLLGEAAVQRYYGMFEACLDAAAKRPPKSQAESLKALQAEGGHAD
jgi:hypothetical protein